jgi:hypothetical protein
VFCRNEVPPAVGDDLVEELARHLDAEDAVRARALAKDLVTARREAESATHVADALVHFAEESPLLDGWVDHSKTGLSTFRIGLNL